MEPRAGSVFTARVWKVPSERDVWIVLAVVFLVWSLLVDEGPDPRYRVLVRRIGAQDEVGVAMARTRRKASHLLAAVQQDLSTLTEREFLDRYGLGPDFGKHRR